MTSDPDFLRLIATCEELAGHFPEGVVFIGGIAVYIHAINTESTQPYAETTHDGDFYISIADMADLRDIEEVTPNRRLSKHQLIKAGFEFDIYTERYSSLIVPYSEVIAHSRNYGQLKVAGLEHLFALKIEAYRDRRASAKGSKDAKDLIRIATISLARGEPLAGALIRPYLREEHLALLADMVKRPEFTGLARGNAMQAKRLREQFASVVTALTKDS